MLLIHSDIEGLCTPHIRPDFNIERDFYYSSTVETPFYASTSSGDIPCPLGEVNACERGIDSALVAFRVPHL